MLRMLNWILHAFTGCPEKGLYQVMYGSTHCRYCGRVAFIGDSLPKLSRFRQSPRKVWFAS